VTCRLVLYRQPRAVRVRLAPVFELAHHVAQHAQRHPPVHRGLVLEKHVQQQRLARAQARREEQVALGLAQFRVHHAAGLPPQGRPVHFRDDMRGQDGAQFSGGPLGVAEGVASEEVMRSRHANRAQSIRRARSAQPPAPVRLPEKKATGPREQRRGNPPRSATMWKKTLTLFASMAMFAGCGVLSGHPLRRRPPPGGRRLG
jgi:hypothetical protein